MPHRLISLSSPPQATHQKTRRQHFRHSASLACGNHGHQAIDLSKYLGIVMSILTNCILILCLCYCQDLVGSLSSCMENASVWHKPQQHLSPVDLRVSQAIGDAFQHPNLGVTALCIAIGGVIIKVIENGLTPML